MTYQHYATLNSLGANFNFIDIWLYNFRHNYFARSESYTVAMVEIFKTMPQHVEKPLTTRKKNQKLITDIGGYSEASIFNFHS